MERQFYEIRDLSTFEVARLVDTIGQISGVNSVMHRIAWHLTVPYKIFNSIIVSPKNDYRAAVSLINDEFVVNLSPKMFTIFLADSSILRHGEMSESLADDAILVILKYLSKDCTAFDCHTMHKGVLCLNIHKDIMQQLKVFDQFRGITSAQLRNCAKLSTDLVVCINNHKHIANADNMYIFVEKSKDALLGRAFSLSPILMLAYGPIQIYIAHTGIGFCVNGAAYYANIEDIEQINTIFTKLCEVFASKSDNSQNLFSIMKDMVDAFKKIPTAMRNRCTFFDDSRFTEQQIELELSKRSQTDATTANERVYRSDRYGACTAFFSE